MKTLGIIGGLGPESTVDYYHSIIAEYQRRKPDGSYPPILINSVNLKIVADGIGAGEFGMVTNYLLDELHKLARAGADFALISANTPHVVFDDLRRQFPLPLLSIVEATCHAAQAQGFKRLALLGTRFTMEGRFYPAVFSRRGVELVVPTPTERAYLHEKYMDELVKGVFLPETRAGLVAIAERMKKEDQIEGLILGGTELPLILREIPGLPLLDTTQIHVKAAVAEMLSDAAS
jgi:aspartate racemase